MVAHAVLVLQRTFSHQGDDLHIVVHKDAEALAPGYGILIQYPQCAEMHAVRVVPTGEAERMPRIQPAVIGMPAAAGPVQYLGFGGRWIAHPGLLEWCKCILHVIFFHIHFSGMLNSCCPAGPSGSHLPPCAPWSETTVALPDGTVSCRSAGNSKDPPAPPVCRASAAPCPSRPRMFSHPGC